MAWAGKARAVRSITVGALVCLLATGARAQSSLPSPRETPGVTDGRVNQGTIGQTICRRGWTRSVRPPEAYTEGMKRGDILAHGYPDRSLQNYQLDHLIPLELGGDPTDPGNLWAEPLHPADGWGAGLKDELEHKLNYLVCTGRLPLTAAQHDIATDWESAYNRYIIGE